MHLDDDQAFGARLLEERERLGLKDFELSHLAGRTPLHQRRFEAGTSIISPRYLQALALRSDVDVLYVLTGERSQMSEPPTSAEIKLLEQFRAMAPADQEAVARIVEALAKD